MSIFEDLLNRDLLAPLGMACCEKREGGLLFDHSLGEGEVGGGGRDGKWVEGEVGGGGSRWRLLFK